MAEAQQYQQIFTIHVFKEFRRDLPTYHENFDNLMLKAGLSLSRKRWFTIFKLSLSLWCRHRSRTFRYRAASSLLPSSSAERGVAEPGLPTEHVTKRQRCIVL
ncbi:hypothetical protein T4E_253 [Trichinella pseudospiralis]|uniref:Uncharacterized protein n=1 Tax=Trichinella pseudospiralis TaxID=6337 RepID=A0A0V0YFK8_TRIPS|nr:hypothetical protein T4E_253 [Trichinella pseudospiralis]